ncbi:host attachment protein [Roseibium litorale]|uniref:Host attachment protein n=1 Tax=Roseibium litorale TaxID=2803841 RepID=A0ABR9CP95_9HYPH|nr:host attachment protein [Roseibium litorale]MBD8892671.1 host attachment protein [Roseibium litorale]
MKRPKTWFLVTDGAKARLVREVMRNSETNNRQEDIVFEREHERLGEIMSDRPGRSFSSHDNRRSAMEYHSDPVHEQQERLAEMLVDKLEAFRIERAFDHLVIVAEPRMLGILRKILPETLKSVVSREVAKDLTSLPEGELQDALMKLAHAG